MSYLTSRGFLREPPKLPRTAAQRMLVSHRGGNSR